MNLISEKTTHFSIWCVLSDTTTRETREEETEAEVCVSILDLYHTDGQQILSYLFKGDFIHTPKHQLWQRWLHSHSKTSTMTKVTSFTLKTRDCISELILWHNLYFYILNALWHLFIDIYFIIIIYWLIIAFHLKECDMTCTNIMSRSDLYFLCFVFI